MTRRKVENDHRVVEPQEGMSPAEQLIAQQSDVSEEYEFGEDESPDKDTEEREESPSEDTEPKKEESPSEDTEPENGMPERRVVVRERVVVLVGAASYYGCGRRFFKNTEALVDEETYLKLLSTGFFVGA